MRETYVPWSNEKVQNLKIREPSEEKHRYWRSWRKVRPLTKRVNKDRVKWIKMEKQKLMSKTGLGWLERMLERSCGASWWGGENSSLNLISRVRASDNRLRCYQQRSDRGSWTRKEAWGMMVFPGWVESQEPEGHRGKKGKARARKDGAEEGKEQKSLQVLWLATALMLQRDHVWWII